MTSTTPARRWWVLAAATACVLLPTTPPAHGLDEIGWPVAGEVSREFDPPDPDWLPGHRGIDLGVESGAMVTTPRAGIVAFVGPVAGTPTVVVQHGAARATYQPVRATVAAGTAVAAGDLIGVIDGRTHCRESCLHWGLRVDDGYADPRLLLGRVHVVLTSEGR